MEDIDLDIENYSLNDLYKLFNVEQGELDYEAMKHAKKIVLKMHPDKSNLDAKFFLFFSTAYKKLHSIYEFQNKSSRKTIDNREYDENNHVLNELFEKNKHLKNPKNFNQWFNTQFEKNKLENDNDEGYGDWLKTDEGLFKTENVTQATMHQEFEKQKKNIQTLSVYSGVTDAFSSTLGGSLLGKNDDYSSGLFDSNGLPFQDLKKAHLETIIPITSEDYNNMPKFRSVQEYKSHRDRQNITPLNEKEAVQKLKYKEKQMDEESAHLAFYYAKQNEEAAKKSNSFWSSLKQIEAKK